MSKGTLEWSGDRWCWSFWTKNIIKKSYFFDFPVLRLYYVSVRPEAGERVSAWCNNLVIIAYTQRTLFEKCHPIAYSCMEKLDFDSLSTPPEKHFPVILYWPKAVGFDPYGAHDCLEGFPTTTTTTTTGLRYVLDLILLSAHMVSSAEG